MTTRLPNWPQAFAAYLAQRRCMPFAWGTHDCCQFARRGAEAITGIDPGTIVAVGDYSDAAGAQAQLEALGGLEAIPQKCGFAEIPVTRAQRGDWVAGPFGREGKAAIGLCDGEKSAFLAAKELQFKATLECSRAWRVG